MANDVSQEGAGFDVETNIVTLVFPDGRTKPLEKMSKLEVAQRILDEVVAIRKAVGSGQVRQIGKQIVALAPLGERVGRSRRFHQAVRAGRGGAVEVS